MPELGQPHSSGDGDGEWKCEPRRKQSPDNWSLNAVCGRMARGVFVGSQIPGVRGSKA